MSNTPALSPKSLHTMAASINNRIAQLSNIAFQLHEMADGLAASVPVNTVSGDAGGVEQVRREAEEITKGLIGDFDESKDYKINPYAMRQYMIESVVRYAAKHPPTAEPVASEAELIRTRDTQWQIRGNYRLRANPNRFVSEFWQAMLIEMTNAAVPSAEQAEPTDAEMRAKGYEKVYDGTTGLIWQTGGKKPVVVVSPPASAPITEEGWPLSRAEADTAQAELDAMPPQPPLTKEEVDKHVADTMKLIAAEGKVETCNARHGGSAPNFNCQLPVGHSGYHYFCSGEISFQWVCPLPPARGIRADTAGSNSRPLPG